MTLDKITRNRKILRKIDLNIAKHGRYELFGYLAVLLIINTSGKLYSLAPLVSLVFGCCLLFLSALHFYYSLRFEVLYARGPGKWRRHYMGIHLVTSAVWGVFVTFICAQFEVSANSFIVVLLSVCIGAISNVEWAPYHRANYISQSLLFLPVIGVLVSIGHVDAFVMGGIILAVYGMLLQQSRSLHLRYWQTEQSRYEAELKSRDLAHAVIDAQTASQVKAEFLANITHEIRTPMNNVLGMLALLDETELSAQQKQLQNVAVHSGEALLRLIDDVLDFSKIVSHTVALNDSVFSLRRCINQTLELLGPLAHGRGIELCVTYDRNLPLRLRGDQDRLAQVITNLVANAIRYSDGSEVVIRLSMDREGDFEGALRVDVIDDGKGIAVDVQHTIFEAFSRSESISGVQGGGGLGLAIAKGLAECMGGEIGFESSDSGTHFWFTARLGVSTQQAQKQDNLKPLERRQVLVVNATEGLEDALQSELLEHEVQIIGVQGNNHGLHELLKAAEEDRPFAAVFINQPIREKFNLDLVNLIKAEESLSDLKQVVMATLSQRGANDQLLNKSKNIEWLTKPITRSGVTTAVQRLYNIHDRDRAIMHAAEASNQAEEAIKRVLLVEDNKVNQMVARGMLNKLGYIVTTANNGKEALSILEDKPFDMVLMDCLMPEMDGYEATRAIREREAGASRIPIVAMTASVIDGEEARCLAAGMDDYLAKPVNKEELSAKLRQWLGGDGSTEKKVNSDDKVGENTGSDRRKMA